MTAAEQVRILRERITDEIFLALGMSKTGVFRRSLGWLFRLPTQRFASIFSSADQAAGETGLYGAGQELLRNLSVSCLARGLETLPQEGPLIVASNHPGAYDSAALAASIPRLDVKIIVYEIPFYHALENIQQRMIFVSPNPDLRMSALRSAIDHLRSGGALIQFGTGRIDPDPAVQGGSAENLQNWSPSLEIMLRKAPETQLSLAMVSGVLMKRFRPPSPDAVAPTSHRPPAHRRVHAGDLAADHTQGPGHHHADQLCAAVVYQRLANGRQRALDGRNHSPGANFTDRTYRRDRPRRSGTRLNRAKMGATRSFLIPGR